LAKLSYVKHILKAKLLSANEPPQEEEDDGFESVPRSFCHQAAVSFRNTRCRTSSCGSSNSGGFGHDLFPTANVGDAKISALAYHDSGQYDRDLAVVAAQAERWLARRAQAARKPALALNIDETALSNWEIIKLDDFGRPIEGACAPALDAPCGWAAWDQLDRDPAIKPTLQVFRRAREMKVTVFFITGRPESQRAATARNLGAAGYVNYAKLYMVPNGAQFPLCC
jgi:hypothetical protein